MQHYRLERFYTRSDPRGLFPRASGFPGLLHNRLGLFWRPIIDMADSVLAPMRLQMIAPVSAWLAVGDPGRWSWYSMIGVPGLRHQVLRHAGLDHYDCREPSGLAERYRTERWNTLLEAVDRFTELNYATRSLVVFQLSQLSYCELALKLSGVVEPNGDPDHDRYAYEVARLHGRYPGRAPRALPVFTKLSVSAGPPLLVLAACFQGIGHFLRGHVGLDVAHAFEERASTLTRLPDEWHSWLVQSRFHRALAMLRLAERRDDAMRRELDIALGFHERLVTDPLEEADELAARENARYLGQVRLEAAGRLGDSDVRPLCQELEALDPNCVETRLAIGDAYAARGDYAQAGPWYTRAGELGTGAGALGWFRAGQCYDFAGDHARAVNAMGRCLELDATALDAQKYLQARRPERASPTPTPHRNEKEPRP